MSASLWETAPATAAVKERPVSELLKAKARMEECSRILRDINGLLGRADVSDADKLALLNERAMTKVSALACANLVAACEERMREQARQIQRRHGWLL